jgi:hypothetical protein
LWLFLHEGVDLVRLLDLFYSFRSINSGSEVSVHSPITRTEVPHGIEQRLAQDRVDSGSLPITHDFLATMLGTNRSSVTLAAGILQRKYVIEYTRGAVT